MLSYTECIGKHSPTELLKTITIPHAHPGSDASITRSEPDFMFSAVVEKYNSAQVCMFVCESVTLNLYGCAS